MTNSVNVASLGSAMVADSSGNVGVGTASPSTKLDVNGYTKASGYNFTGYSSGARGTVTTASTFSTLSGDIGYGVSTNIAGGFDIMANQTGVDMRFYCGTANTSPTERMRIASNGSVGIGTTSPDKSLTVQSSSGETVFEITSTSTGGKAYDWISGGSGGNFSGGRFGLYSRTDTTELMAATSNTGTSAGGTTGKGIGFANAGFWIDRGWADYPSLTVCNTSQTGNTNQSQIRMHGTNATWASYPNSAGSDFACSFYIDGTYQSVSDRRFKTNISTIDNALDKVMSMSGKRYQTLNKLGEIEPGFTENGFRFGFIAQELQAAGLDELYKHNVDEDDGTEGYNKAYAVDYDSVAPLLVNAIKEQQAIIEELKARIVALEAK